MAEFVPASSYVVDGQIIAGNAGRVVLEHGQVVSSNQFDSLFAPGDVERMVRDGYLKLAAEALPASDVQAELDALHARLAELEASLKSEAGAPASEADAAEEPAPRAERATRTAASGGE